MNAKKVLAMILATSMVVGSSMTVLAEDASTASSSGTGSVEGYVDMDILSVDFPTSTSFDFTIDPQGLIAATVETHNEITGDVEEGATLLFANTDEGAEYAYSSVSDTLTTTNYSSKGVSISVEATMTSLGNDPTTIAISDSSTFSDDTVAIYMALVDESGEVALDSTEAKATLAGSASAAPDGAYEVVYTSGDGGGYSYSLVSDISSITFDTYDFYLTGASNANADWTDYTGVAPSLSITWSAELVDEVAPTFTATSTGLTYTTGSGDAALASITSITMVYKGTAFDGYNEYSGAWAAATDDGGTITFDSVYTAVYASSTGSTATVTYVNAAGETVVVEVDGVCATN